MSNESAPQNLRPSPLESLRAEIRAGLQSMDQRLAENNKRFESLDARVITEAEAIRVQFDVVAENLRESFKGVID